MSRLPSILRHATTAVISLLEAYAYRAEPTRQVSVDGLQASVQLEWRRRHIIVKGQTDACGLTIAFDGREGVTVGQAFNVQLERPDRLAGATARLSAPSASIHFEAPNGLKVAQALIAATPKVLLSLIRSTSDIYTFLRTKDAATASRLRKAFRITPQDDKACSLPNDMFLNENREVKADATATIVVPVFNAANDLMRLLSRLKETHYPIILINDGSDDPLVASLLTEFKETVPSTIIISHPINLGFVAAANAGIAQAKGHVILLNSDTLPPAGDWASRLIEPILNDPNVASVTPFSNNAEILSIPHSNIKSDISEHFVDQIDIISKNLNFKKTQYKLPTGIGFCMAMNSQFLKKVGHFDEIFGRGYGEEVDWCQKAYYANGRNIGLASLFVGHKGSASFKQETAKQRENAASIISQRYPSYDASVQSWVKNAPAQPHVLALSIAWLSASAEQAIPVYLGHSMGGGAETALSEEVKKALKTNLGVIILRVGGPSLWRIELKGRDFSTIGDTASIDVIKQLLAPIKRMHLVYSCGVGGRHPLDAPNLLLHLFDERCRLDVNIHDFFPVSPSWNLLNGRGNFAGIPAIETSDPAHSVPALANTPAVSHKRWRDIWGRVFSLSERVVVYSNAVGDLIVATYPSVAQKIRTTPHELCKLPHEMQGGGKTVGILGSLNQAKGAEVIQRLSASTFNTRKLVVLGEMDKSFKLKKPSIFHGRFQKEQINELAEKYDIGVWFIPSICPETFSFTTHEALATGLPVLAFARGAQGEAVEKNKNGHRIDADPEDTKAISMAIEQAFAT